MRRRRPQKQASKLHRGENYFGALRAFGELGGPSEDLGVLLRETKNPRPAEIRESSGEQFPLYRVAIMRPNSRSVSSCVRLRCASRASTSPTDASTGRPAPLSWTVPMSDPWTPVIANKDGARALNVDSHGWSYAQLVRLLFPRVENSKESVTASPLQRIAGNDPSEGITYLARVLVRGQGKTEGYFERRVPVSKVLSRMLRQHATDKVAHMAHQRVEVAGEMARNV
eukprot:gene35643-47929_t